MVGNVDSEFFYGFLGRRSTIKFFSLLPLSLHTTHEPLPLTRTWWPP
jgi:hypothetical protein